MNSSQREVVGCGARERRVSTGTGEVRGSQRCRDLRVRERRHDFSSAV